MTLFPTHTGMVAFRHLVERCGSVPFSVQGPECGLAVEGGQTLAWEILEAVARDYPCQYVNFVRVGVRVALCPMVFETHRPGVCVCVCVSV